MKWSVNICLRCMSSPLTLFQLENLTLINFHFGAGSRPSVSQSQSIRRALRETWMKRREIEKISLSIPFPFVYALDDSQWKLFSLLSFAPSPFSFFFCPPDRNWEKLSILIFDGGKKLLCSSKFIMKKENFAELYASFFFTASSALWQLFLITPTILFQKSLRNYRKLSRKLSFFLFFSPFFVCIILCFDSIRAEARSAFLESDGEN